jgi:AcrR family transcriptional regulator
MEGQSPDHRHATAVRNVAAILDATERLLERRGPLTIQAIATAAGVSRVTVYAHFANLAELVEAVVERTVRGARVAIEAAEPDRGPAGEAFERLIRTSWLELDRESAIAGAAAQQLPSEGPRRGDEAAVAAVRRLVSRGREEGAIRADLPADWLVTTFFALLHAAADEARAARVGSDDALDVLTTTIRDVFGGSAPAARSRR